MVLYNFSFHTYMQMFMDISDQVPQIFQKTMRKKCAI